MSAFFGAVTTKIGGFFMSVALLLGASAPVTPTPAPAETISAPVEIVEEAVATTEGDVSSSTDTPQKTISVAVPVIDAPKSKVPEESKNAPLSITDVDVDLDERNATFTWRTTVEARSSIVIDEETLDSVEGVSKTHTVSIKNLTKGAKYPYEIAAKTLGESPAEDRIFRTLLMPATYTISIKPHKDINCSVFSVTDQEDNSIGGYALEISNGDFGHILGREDFTTDSRGEIKHCRNGTYFKIQGKDIAKVVGQEDIVISNYGAENLTVDDLKEYGTFSVSFNLLQNDS